MAQHGKGIEMNKITLRNIETNTFPVIVHANGMAKNPGSKNYGSWPAILEAHNETDFEKNNLRDDLTVVTWKGDRYAKIDTALEKSAACHGFKLKFVPWSDHIKDFWKASIVSKIENTLKAIKSKEINTKYIMLMDASDVIFLEHPNDILEKSLNLFSEYETVWCGEANNWPNFNLPKYCHYPVLDEFLTKISKRDNDNSKIYNSRFVYLNAGCAIGKTESLIEFYETGLKICNNFRTADQAVSRVSQYVLQNKHAIDCKCELFQCLYDVGLESLEIK